VGYIVTTFMFVKEKGQVMANNEKEIDKGGGKTKKED
jgi:hypothetical protein